MYERRSRRKGRLECIAGASTRPHLGGTHSKVRLGRPTALCPAVADLTDDEASSPEAEREMRP